MRPYEVIADAKKDEALWLEARKDYVTGSMAHKLLTSRTWESFHKARIRVPVVTEIMARGSRMEIPNMQLFSKLSMAPTRPCNAFLASTKYPGLGATLDGLMRGPSRPSGMATFEDFLRDSGMPQEDVDWLVLEGQTLGLVEMKHSGIEQEKHYLKGGMPRRYYAQCQHQLAVTGLPYCLLITRLGGNREVFAVRLIRPDKELHRTLSARAAEYFDWLFDA